MNAVTQPFTPTAGAVSSDAASPTMADAILAVAGWSTRSERRRGDIISSLKTAARIIGKRPEEVLLDPPALRAVLTGRPARTYGLEPKRYQNVLSDLRNVLRTLHISCPKVPGGQIPGHWGEVLAAASSNWERMRLVRFARFCESSQIEPTQVDDTAVERFADHEARTEVAANMGTRAWGATRSWNAISTRRPDLGLRTVALRRRFNQYTVPETSFSATFIADLDTWCRRAVRGDPADVFADLDVGQPDAPLAPLRQLRASTVALRRRQVILAASALVHAGRDPSTIRTLRDLVEPWETVRTIAQIHYNRRSSEATTGVYGILEALRQIAKHYVCVDPTLLRQITLLRNRVTPRRAGISKRNRERLRPLEDMRHRAALLHLPAELLRQAASARNERRRKRLATCAAALEILLICPMRISNMAGLRLDRHFRYALGGRRQLTHIVIDGAETKAGVPIDWPVPPASLPVICEFACNTDPLRGNFASNSDPLRRSVTIPSLWPEVAGEGVRG